MDLIKPLVIASRLAPRGRCRVAVALAELHDTSAGEITASMALIAELASLSTAQARKHVHALVWRRAWHHPRVRIRPSLAGATGRPRP